MTQENYLKSELYAAMRTDTRFFDFLEQASLDGIWYWDLENLEQEWMSPSFWRLFGVDPDTKAHLASEWQDIIHPDDLATAIENFEKHLADPEHPYDQIVRYRHVDGSYVTVRCRGLIIRDENGKPLRMLGAHNDLTELENTRATLAAELEKYEMLSSAKTAFMSMMSHEIRTPLNAIIGLFELIAATSADEKQSLRAEKGLVASQQLFGTLSTVLDAAKLENGAVVARPEPVRTSELANRVQAVIEGACQRYEFVGGYTVDIADGTPRDLVVDVGILLQVLTNLLDNAIKFSDDKLVRVLFAPAGPGMVRISVTDQGKGMSEADQAHVFDPFFQAERSNVRKVGGTGLGLSIVKQLVDVLHGRVELFSAVGSGTEVHVDIPVQSAQTQEV